MLINAQRPEELRIAVVDGNRLENYQIEAAEASQTRGNIYRGIVSGLQPSLGAAFIDYGIEKHGFLSLDNLVPEAWHHKPASGKRPRIEEVLERGKSILVLVSREPEGQKGAALTTNLSLAGRYLVFYPFEQAQGVSRKVEDEESRNQLRELAASLRVPDGSGVIIRTNAAGQNKTAINRDLQALLRLWKQIQSDAKKGTGPKLLQSDQDLILRALRDYVDASIAEIVIDDEAAFEKAREYVRTFLPRSKTRLVRYEERAPLFAKYDLEPQIDRIYERSVDLAGGGSIVIDRTEALVAIDVNSGRSKSGSHEETVLQTNLEAAQEVGRHLQLRDIGGLIVVDFIDMKNPRNRRRVEAAVKEALRNDKARTTVGRLSPNGLLEINRQKIRQALHLRTHRACPTCAGTGRIASPEMVSLNLLRRIEARATTASIEKVRVSLHPELADAFQNWRRQEIAALEREFDIDIEVIAASHLHRPQQELEWFEGEPEELAPTSSAEKTEPARADAGEGTKKRKRRRRRRGRGDEAAAGGSSTAPIQVPDPIAGIESWERDVPPGEQDHAEGDEQAPAAAARRKRRRRRRGRGGAERSEGPALASNGHPPETDEAPPTHADPEPSAPSGSEPAAAGEGARRPRRRSRRHRKSRAGAAAPSAAEPRDSEASEGGEIVTSFWDLPEESAVESPLRARRGRTGSDEEAGPEPAPSAFHSGVESDPEE
ncbi:MAG TPA: Rne/Rng family ribonuclease [Thermoanaerobaculia bacterium]|nr:Rne/Rng family ribonuclease [Thermoanaerobaculia bacterium]